MTASPKILPDRFGNHGGAIRDHILGWPGKLAEMCAERSRAEIEEILIREAYEVLEELAEGLPTS